MFINLRNKHTLSPEWLNHLADTLERELSARYGTNVRNENKHLNIQKVLDAIKPASNIRTNILKNYRFKN